METTIRVGVGTELKENKCGPKIQQGWCQGRAKGP